MERQKLSRRDFLRLGALTAAGAALVGCVVPTPPAEPAAEAPEATTPPEPTPEPAPAEKEKVTFVWAFAHAVELHEELEKEWNEMSDTIELEVQVIPQADAVPKLTTQWSSGAGPDSTALSPMWLAQFAAAGWLEDLEPHISGTPLEQDLAPVAFEAGRLYQDTLYMIGHILGVYPLYYHKALFEEAGLPGPPETIDQFHEYAIQLTDPAKNQYGYYQLGASGWAFQQWSLWEINEGGNGVNNTLFAEDGTCIFRGEEQKAGLQRFIDLYKVDKVTPQASATGGFLDAKEAFCAGQVGMVMGFAPYISNFDECLGPEGYGVAVTPAGAAGSWNHYGCNGYAVSSDSEVKDASWEVVQWFLSPEIDSRVGEAFAALPTNVKAFGAEWLDRPHWEAPKQQAASSDLIHTARELPEWANFQSNYNVEQLQLLLLDEQTIDEFTENVSSYLEEAKAAAS